MSRVRRLLSRVLPGLALALVLIGAAGPALADPATMIIAGLTSSGITVSAMGAAAIRIGVGLAFSALSTALMAGAANANGAPRGITLRSTTAGEQVPQGFILGRYVTAGNLAAPEMSHGVSGDTRYLTRVIDLSDLPVDSLESLIIDGVRAELATGTPATLTMTQGDGTTPAIHPDYGPTVAKGDFIGCAWCRFRDGSQTTADPMLLAKYGSYPQRPWSSAMVGRGVAQAILTFLWRDSPQVWQGRPDVRCVVKGIRLYDPRKDSTAGGSGAHRYGTVATHEWSENPVVMIYNLLRGIQIPGGQVYGGGFAAADLPYAIWAAAMNACDVMIGERRTYVAGLEVVMGGSDAGGQSPADVIEELLKACSGQIADLGGTIIIRVGAPGLPVRFLTDDDILVSQGQELDPFPGAQDSTNIVHATWMSPGNLWTPKEAAPRRDEAAITADGQELPAALALPAVNVAGQVQQLMSGWLRDAQRHRRQTITLPPEGILLQPLDVIDWTSARNGYVGKSFEIGQVTIDPLTLCTTLALREVDPDDYDWAVGDDSAVSVPSIEPVIPAPVTVPGFSATATTIKDGTGADRLPAIRLGWSLPLPGVTGVRFQIRVAATGTVAVEGSTANVDAGYHIVAEGIVANVAYQARARLIGPKTTEWTAWVTVTAPDVGITATDFQGSIEEVFRDAGLAPVEIVTSLPATGNFAGRTVYLTTDAKLYRWDGTAWTAAVATVDLVGQIVADQVADGAITTAKFAAGIAPVEIVSTLPATGNFEGRTVYLTTDNKLYRHTGSPTGAAGFTAAVPAMDLVGTVVAAQIADGAITTAKFANGLAPVEIVSALPTSGNFAGRTVYLTTDTRLYRHTGTAWTAAVPTTDLTGQITSAQIADAAVTTAKFAAGIEPIEIVGALPATGNVAGRTVFLTTDSKLYRYTGSAWTAAVPATDITGQLAAAQIADAAITTAKFASGIAPVEIVGSLPVSGNFEGRTVYLTSDDKLYRFTGSAFVSTVPTTDLTGTIATGQIADGAVTATKVADGAVTAAKFAAGLTPVEIVATLPTTGNVEGRIVYLTTDDKLYRHTGSAWTAAVPATDVTGQLVSAQIADAAITTAKFAAGIAPVEIVATLPTTGNYEGRTVYLTGDDKLYRHNGTAFVASVAAADVTGTLTSAQIADAAVTTAKFASGIRPVEILGTLPTTGNFEGRMVFLTTDDKLYRHNGTAFVSTVPATDVTGQVVAAQIADAAITTAKFAADLRPVEIVATLPTTGNVEGRLVYLTTDNKLYRHDGTAFVASVAAADVTGQLTNAQIAALDAAKLTGQITSTQITDDAITTPKIAAGAITTAEIAAGAVTATGIAAGAVTTTRIAAGAVTATEIAAGAITATKIAVDAVTAGAIAAGAVSTSELAAGAVTAAKIAAGTITANEIATNTIATGNIAADAVTTDKIAAGAVTATELAAESVTAGAIAVGAVSTSELSAGAVTAAKIAAGTITATEIAAGAITTAKLAAGAVTATEMAAGAITATRLAADSVTAGAIAAGAVSTSELAADAVTADKIAAGAVTASEIAAGAITTTKLAAGAVTANELGANAVTAAKIAADAVTAGAIAAGAVTASEIAAGAVHADKLSVLARELVNPVSVTRNLIGWGGVLEDGTGGNPAILNHDATENAIRLTSSGNQGLYCRSFQVNHAAIYRVTARMRKNVAGGLAHIGLLATAARVEGALANTTGLTVEPFSTTRAPVTPTTNSYFHAGTGTDTYVDHVYYILGANRSVEDCPLPVGPGGTPFVRLGADASWCAIRVLNWDNLGVARDLFIKDISVIEAGTGQIVATNIQASAITADKIAAGAVTTTKLAVDSVTAGAIAAGAVSTSELAADAVTADKIAAGTITANEIATGAITTTLLAADAVTTDKIAAGAITATELAVDSVTAGAIAAGAVSTTELAASAVTAAKIAAGTITANEIAADTITGAKVAAGTITASELAADSVTATQLAADSVTAGAIAAGAISTSELAADAVTTEKIAAGAVTATEIAANAVTATQIAADAVTTAKIAAGAITATEIATDTITAGKIAAGAIGASEIAADAVTTTKIAAGSVTATEIAANAITAAKIAADAVTADKIAANAVTSQAIAANAITAGLIAAGAIDTTDLIVDGAVSRRVYARGSNVTLTTGLQVIVSKTFGSGSFAAFQGTAGSRSNPILLNLDFDITIYAGQTGWHTLTIQAGLNVSGTWQTDFLVQTFRVPLDAGTGTIQYTKTYVVDSGSWSTAAAMRVRMIKAATPARIDASGDYMLTQISV